MRGRRMILAPLAVLSVCCSTAPATPTPIDPPPPNAPPVIKSIVVSASRTEVGTPVEIKATVEDLESGIGTLRFDWSASGGVFTGEGPVVTWQVPAGAAEIAVTTPVNHEISVTVIEQYSALDAAGQLITREHRVNSSPAVVRVHDSPQELEDLGVRFLSRFGDSSVSPETCVLEFSDGCSGKRAELDEIRDNREYFVILSSRLEPGRVNIRSAYGEADVEVSCGFESRVLKCAPPGHPWFDSTCFAGRVERAEGTCRLTAVYEEASWWLCGSNFHAGSALSPMMRLFFGGSTSR